MKKLAQFGPNFVTCLTARSIKHNFSLSSLICMYQKSQDGIDVKMKLNQKQRKGGTDFLDLILNSLIDDSDIET